MHDATLRSMLDAEFHDRVRAIISEVRSDGIERPDQAHEVWRRMTREDQDRLAECTEELVRLGRIE